MPTPTTRERPTGLLVRPPASMADADRWRAPVIDPVDQLAELADLHVRGLLSRSELALQVAKVIQATRAG